MIDELEQLRETVALQRGEIRRLRRDLEQMDIEKTKGGLPASERKSIADGLSGMAGKINCKDCPQHWQCKRCILLRAADAIRGGE